MIAAAQIIRSREGIVWLKGIGRESPRPWRPVDLQLVPGTNASAGGEHLNHQRLSCDDRDPCTVDGCNAASGCLHEATTGYASVLCVFERTAIGVACGDALPLALTTRMGKTALQIEKASGAGAPRSECRLLRRSARSARKSQRLAARARDRGSVSPECGQAIADEMAHLRGGIADLRAQRCSPGR